jgi:hypothetical protein
MKGWPGFFPWGISGVSIQKADSELDAFGSNRYEDLACPSVVVHPSGKLAPSILLRRLKLFCNPWDPKGREPVELRHRCCPR